MKTTVFKNGGSQAIRIPAQFRFAGENVDIEWDESLGALIVREGSDSAWETLFEAIESQPPFVIPEVVPLKENGRIDVAALMDSV